MSTTQINMRRLALALAATMSVMRPSHASAQQQTFALMTDVALTLSLDSASYRVGEQITLRYRIENISNRSLYAPRASAQCPKPYPHFLAWFEDSTGHHPVFGYGFSCGSGPGTSPPRIAERMAAEAVLLKPGEHFDGTFQMPMGGTSDRVTAGAYRVEAILYGWKDQEFSAADRQELERLGAPFLIGEFPASMRVIIRGKWLVVPR